MGYFDALTSGYFKTAPDGRKLFFPWGVLGRGYAIDSEQDYERLRRQVKAYTIVSLVLIVAVTALQAYVGAVVIGALLIAFYLGWMRYLLRGLYPSDERLSLQDSMTSQARAQRDGPVAAADRRACVCRSRDSHSRARSRQLARCVRLDRLFRALRGLRDAPPRAAAARGGRPPVAKNRLSTGGGRVAAPVMRSRAYGRMELTRKSTKSKQDQEYSELLRSE